MTSEVHAGRRARSKRAEVNDRVLLDAARAMTVDLGWDAVNLHAVAKRVGMTSRAMDDRFGSRTSVAVAVWMDGPGAAVTSGIVELVDALVPGAGESGQDLQAAIAGVDRLLRPDDTLAAALEVMCAATFDSKLRDAIAFDLERALGKRLVLDPLGAPRHQIVAAQVAYVVVTALGLLLAYRRPGAASVNLSPLVEDFAQALANASTPAKLPDV